MPPSSPTTCSPAVVTAASRAEPGAQRNAPTSLASFRICSVAIVFTERSPESSQTSCFQSGESAAAEWPPAISGCSPLPSGLTSRSPGAPPRFVRNERYVPSGDQAGADTLEQLLQSRDRLTHAIAQVIATEIKASGDQVAQAVAKLGDLNKQLQNLAASIDAAKTGIAITAQVLNVLAQVVGAVL